MIRAWWRRRLRQKLLALHALRLRVEIVLVQLRIHRALGGSVGSRIDEGEALATKLNDRIAGIERRLA